ncbi:DedA family protein [Paenibacillus sp. LMG 31460]|uniref:DedA family protein n=1 Tax=Paenibacillus germinis TaxID=2654979 RepID=A0ABX1YZD6_9BACL|nr:DedA family protein [Paenibacillus germinis]NOU86351.1 DedA family protein [Paenibacillus germinis]
MDYDTLLQSISNFGYVALFFALWLGIIGMPIPDEVIVMTGGAVSAAGVLHTIPAFIITYLGVVSGLSLGYILGRYLGSPVLEKLRRKKNFAKHLQTAEKMIEKHGNLALSLSYFLPVVRHVIPYLVGINKMPYRRYVLYSYTAGLVWTVIFFVMGHFAGTYVQTIGTMFYHYALYALLALLVLLSMIILIRNQKGVK